MFRRFNIHLHFLCCHRTDHLQKNHQTAFLVLIKMISVQLSKPLSQKEILTVRFPLNISLGT